MSAAPFPCVPDDDPDYMATACVDCLTALATLLSDVTTAQTVCSNFYVDNANPQVAFNDFLASEATALHGTDSDLQLGVDTWFLLGSAYLVFAMQIGFAMVCSGLIRSKNCLNILLKNVLDSCIGALGWYIFGFGFAFGYKPPATSSNEFIGNYNFALSQSIRQSYHIEEGYGGPASYSWHFYIFQWSFSAAATTIVSGAVAERCTFIAYLCYSFLLSAFVYPVIVHWMWSADGWLGAFNTHIFEDGRGKIGGLGAIDFAGSGVVHMVGGVAAFAGAWIMGPRIGRFDASGRVNDMKGHNATLVVLGTFLLWFGWYGFNPGSNLLISSRTNSEIVGRVATTTTLAAAAGGAAVLFTKHLLTKTWDVPAVCNGVLAGLVGITAGCSTIEPWAALICGGCAGWIMLGMEWFVLYKLKVDDPVSASAVHMAGGAFGVFFVGLMARPDYVHQVYGGYNFGDQAVYEERKYGAFYGGSGFLLLAQIIEIAVILAWVGGLMSLFFFIMKLLKLLRVPVEVELAGLDISKHGGSAYYGDATMEAPATMKVAPAP